MVIRLEENLGIVTSQRGGMTVVSETCTFWVYLLSGSEKSVPLVLRGSKFVPKQKMPNWKSNFIRRKAGCDNGKSVVVNQYQVPNHRESFELRIFISE